MRYARIRRALQNMAQRPSRVLMAFATALLFAFLAVAGCTSAPQEEAGCPFPLCNGLCINYQADPAHCGQCGAACGAGMACVNFQCQCSGGLAACAAGCVDTTLDAANCGSCNAACSAGSVCTGSTCQCQGGLTSCPTGCSNLTGDGANCGACGNACGAGLVCSNGQCSATCATGLTQCGSSCVDTNTAYDNCGTCGNVCPTGRSCSGGLCACPTGQQDCGGTCTDTLTNSANCGTCGNVCTGGQVCSGGACSCPAGVDCSGGTGGASGTGGSVGVGGAGTGGAGTGGAGTGGAGTGGAASTDCEPGVDCGGYIDNGVWHGYAFTSSYGTGTITPAAFAVVDFPRCASGKVPGIADGTNGAMIGWSVNQAANPANAPKLGVAPAAGMKGITVKVSNPGGSELRIQIQDADGGKPGAEGAQHRWCAVIPGDGGFVPYEAFNTECWTGGDGTAYAGQAITQVMVQVPSKATDTNFDFCINELYESVDTSGPVGTGCALGTNPGTGNFTLSNDGTASVVRDGRNYIVQNNVWAGDKTKQEVSGTGVSFTVTKQNNNGASSSGAPLSYPSVFIGSNYGRNPSGDNLPKQVSALTKVPTAWRWSGGGNGNFNAAYDVWFSTSASGDAEAPSGGYLMVWYRDAPNAQPLGAISGSSVSVGGRNWQVWTCASCQLGKPAISFVPLEGGQVTQLSQYSFDLNDFIKKGVELGIIKSNWYLSNIFVGFEIWADGVGVKSEDFCAVVE